MTPDCVCVMCVSRKSRSMWSLVNENDPDLMTKLMEMTEPQTNSGAHSKFKYVTNFPWLSEQLLLEEQKILNFLNLA
jgi:hypothetical protein